MNKEVLNELLKEISTVNLVIGVIGLIVYLILARLLAKYYKLLYSKRCLLAYIPIINLYILGNLLINWIFGISLICLMIVGFIINNIGLYIGIAILYLILYIWVIGKYLTLKRFHNKKEIPKEEEVGYHAKTNENVALDNFVDGEKHIITNVELDQGDPFAKIEKEKEVASIALNEEGNTSLFEPQVVVDVDVNNKQI